MRRALTLTLGLLFFAAGTIVACAEDDPEPGFTPTGGSGGSESAGSAGSMQGGGGSGGSGQAGGGPRAGSGGGGAGGQAGTGGQGGACAVDANEPNNNPVQATALVTAEGNDNIMSDCDGEDSVNGLLDGPDDADWFSFSGEDESTCGIVDPDMQPQARVESPSPVEVCIFVKPNNGPVQCADGSRPDDELSEAEYVGCCNEGSARAIIEGTLGGGDEDDNGADVKIKVSKLSGALCGAFKLNYAFVDP